MTDLPTNPNDPRLDELGGVTADDYIHVELNGMTPQERAEERGVAAGTIRKNISDAKKALADMEEPESIPEPDEPRGQVDLEGEPVEYRQLPDDVELRPGDWVENRHGDFYRVTDWEESLDDGRKVFKGLKSGNQVTPSRKYRKWVVARYSRETWQATGGGLALGQAPPEPSTPDWAPEYLATAVSNPRRTADQLRELAAYCERRADVLEHEAGQPADLDELKEKNQALVAVQSVDVLPPESDPSDGRGRIHWVSKPCGDESCNSCPHGPYPYVKWREGGRSRSEYLKEERRPADVPEEVTAFRAGEKGAA